MLNRAKHPTRCIPSVRHHRTTRWIRACGPSLVLAMLLTFGQGCVPASIRPATKPVAGTDVLRFAWPDVGVPTPFRVSAAGPGGVVLLSLLYDTLTWKDERGIIPWLAARWEVSPDGRDYTFTLVRDVRWSDGKPLTAGDIAFSFELYARFPYRWMSTDIVERSTVLAADRVQVRLKRPYAAFLDDIAGVVPIVPHHVWSSVSDPTTYGGPDASVGSGPYTLAEYRPAEGAYRLTANADYFKGAPTVGEVQQLNISAETQLQALQQGQIDLMLSTDASVGSVLKEDPRVRVLETAPLSVVRLAVNTDRPPLDRAEVRQALLYALDRSRIASTVTRGPPIVGSAGVVPPETPWFNPNVRTYAFDPARTRTLLGGQPLTIELLANPEYREPELLEPMLRAVGVTLITRRVDARTKAQLLREGRFQLAEVQHIGIGGDPDYLRRWYSGEEANDAAQGSIFRDSTYADLGSAQALALNPADRKEIVDRMQEILADQLPTLPLYYRRFYWVYDATRFTPMNTWGGLMNGIPFAQNKLSLLRRSVP